MRDQSGTGPYRRRRWRSRAHALSRGPCFARPVGAVPGERSQKETCAYCGAQHNLELSPA